MTTQCAVAYSILQDSFSAGAEMAEIALKKEKFKSCDFAFIFASGEHNQNNILEGVKSVLGDDTCFIGGTSSGVITNDYIGYEGYHAGILIISSNEIEFDILTEKGLEGGENQVGKSIGKRLKSLLMKPNPNLLLLYDMVRSIPKNGIIYYKSAPILRGIEAVLGNWPRTAGVGLATFSGIKKTQLWSHNETLRDGVMGLVMSGRLQMDTIIMHGCKPASDYHTITKMEDNIVYELDGQPPFKLIEKYLGPPDEIDWKAAAYFITLGVNRGKKYEPFQEGNYVNRMVMHIDEKTGALTLLEDDLQVGDAFQFMRRSIETDMVADRTRELLNSINGRKPLFAFYISCLGRIKKNFGTDKEEASEVQEVLGNRFPLLGIYSGTEIASINGKIMPLDWTGVLCLFSLPE